MLFTPSASPPLVGIARLAARSPLLEAKSRVSYFEIPARSILNRTKPNMPFQWTINPYRGCEFGCRYCFARFTHEFMGLEDSRAFEDKIFAKAAPAVLLKQELRRVGRDEAIAMGTATDPYQPAERRFRRTRAILEVFAAEKGRRLSLTTKSGLVARDIDVMREIARRNGFSVNLTITTLDERLARLMEPRAPRPALRLEAVRRLAGAGIPVGVFANPVMPGITDSEPNLDAVAAAARGAGAQWLGGGPLFLAPAAQRCFFPFLEEHFPGLLEAYRRQFERNPYLGPRYKDSLRERVARIRERYRLRSAPLDYRPEPDDGGQLTLFPLD